MADSETTKLRLAVGALQLEYEGSEAFLQAGIPKLLHAMDTMQVSRLTVPFNTLQELIEDSCNAEKALNDLILTTKNDLDPMSEMGQMESLRLQMAMDRMSKMMSTLSNILKKMSDTSNAITQNLK